MHINEEMKATLLDNIPRDEKQFVIVCIGTDRNTGDSLGPFVGDFLTEKHLPHTYVYGTIHSPVTALNLENVVSEINIKHPTAFVIGIDAGLGKEESVGKSFVRNYPVRPGSAVGKKLPEVGQLSIVGIVNEHYETAEHNTLSLGNTRLRVVLKMAREITDTLEATIQTHFVSEKSEQKARGRGKKFLQRLFFLKKEKRII